MGYGKPSLTAILYISLHVGIFLTTNAILVVGDLSMFIPMIVVRNSAYFGKGMAVVGTEATDTNLTEDAMTSYRSRHNRA